MKTHSLVQGSQEWGQHRLTHFNASDAPAMMGCSPYTTRTELLTRMKTGITQDVDAGTQRRFDDGHRFEAMARPLAEQIVGEDLYPVTGTNGQLSASFDGLTLLGDTAFEHKTLGDPLRYTPWDEGNGYHLPLHYQVQMEHQLLVSGAERVLFMASRWDGDMLAEERHCWYTSDRELRAKIIAGWAQFAADVAAYTPTAPEAPPPTGKAPETLPALHIVLNGGVAASNLAEFKETALSAIRSVNRNLNTDQDFADADKAVKWCDDVESRIKAAKDHALSQTASIDALFKTMDEISSEARTVRLELEKLVKARKDARKGEIVAAGVAALAQHMRELNAAMPGDYMPTIPADFGGCIKGLRTVASIQNAVDTELARVKIAAADVANRIHANVGKINAANAPGLFADVKTLVLKQPDDLAAIIAQRLATEEKRKADERESIRAEEAARVEREHAHAAKVEADRIAREQQEAVSAARIREERVTIVHASNDMHAALIGDGSPAPDGIPLIQGEIGYVDSGFRIVATSAPLTYTASAGIQRATAERPTLKLGEIGARLGFTVTADFLETLGFTATVEKNARLYRPSQFPAICTALQRHIASAAVKDYTEATQ